MAGKRDSDEETELNLTPMLNMVLILIPLLLLSVVFMEITIIKISMAQQAQGVPQEEPEEPPKRLQLWISKDGFAIYKNGEPVPPISGCEGRTGGMTICNLSGVAEDERDVKKYDWRGLYNELIRIKTEQGFMEHRRLEIVAGSEITFDVIVKAMDHARTQRSTDGQGEQGVVLNSEAEYLDAKPLYSGEGTEKVTVPLFDTIVLGMPSNTGPGG